MDNKITPLWNWDSFLEDEETYANRLEECVRDTIRPLRDYGYVQAKSLALVFESVQDIRNLVVDFVTSATDTRYEDPTDQLLRSKFLDTMNKMAAAYRIYINRYVQAMSQFVDLLHQPRVLRLLGLPSSAADPHIGITHWQCQLPTPALRLTSYVTSLRALVESPEDPATSTLVEQVQELVDITSRVFEDVAVWQRWFFRLDEIDLSKKLGGAGSKAMYKLLGNPNSLFINQSIGSSCDSSSEITLIDALEADGPWYMPKQLVLLDQVFSIRKVFRNSISDITSQHTRVRLVLLPSFLLVCLATPTAEWKPDSPDLAPLWTLATSHISLSKVQLVSCPHSCDFSLVINGTPVATITSPLPVKERWTSALARLVLEENNLDSHPRPQSRPSTPYGTLARKMAGLFGTRKEPPPPPPPSSTFPPSPSIVRQTNPNSSPSPARASPKFTWYRRALPGFAPKSQLISDVSQSVPSTPVNGNFDLLWRPPSQARFPQMLGSLRGSISTTHINLLDPTPPKGLVKNLHRSSSKLRDTQYWASQPLPSWPCSPLTHTVESLSSTATTASH
ncbi:hypothetical protein H4R33_005336 [Dimargaris cristalligena]|nr:hypothetical protein H4R33_005336 [Dimargaris cristalligena]